MNANPMPVPPNADDLHAYLTGRLTDEPFVRVDAWLAALPAAEAEAVLADIAARLPDLSGIVPARADDERGFQSIRAVHRVVGGDLIGSGGTAEVRAVHDRSLDRPLALKVLKPRQPGEDLEAYHLREAAFLREAAVTAGLDHPGILPVYDIGKADGRPAFTMKRLQGCTLAAAVAAGTVPLPDLIQALTRAAEAVAFAHARGIVHRDLSPANVLLADFGAVYVLDWGLAARHGSEAQACVGTPGWTAPEQQQATTVDRRMDVWALGALLHLVLTRQPPGTADVLGRKHPRALVALVRRCLAADPAQRYADAQDVVAELHRWLDLGLTLAQRATHLEALWLRLRRSPHGQALMLAIIASAVAVSGLTWWNRSADRARVELRVRTLAGDVALDQPEAIAVALHEVRALRATAPDLTSAAVLESRLIAARDLAAMHAQLATSRLNLQRLLLRTRQLGPWADQVEPWRAALRATGLVLDAEHASTDEVNLRRSALAGLQAESLAFLWRAEREHEGPGADALARLLAQAGPSPGWQALGRLLLMAPFRAHDPEFIRGEDSDQVLGYPASAALALALFAPEPRLTAYARRRLAEAPGDFWPLIAAGRAALSEHEVHEAQHLAFTASGAEAGSLLPRLLLAYVALINETWPELRDQEERGRHIDPANVELATLRAVALARLGQRGEAQRLVDGLPAGHLRYHLSHRVGHPMELAVAALVAAGLHIADAAPDLGPLTPAHHHH